MKQMYHLLAYQLAYPPLQAQPELSTARKNKKGGGTNPPPELLSKHKG